LGRAGTDPARSASTARSAIRPIDLFPVDTPFGCLSSAKLDVKARCSTRPTDPGTPFNTRLAALGRVPIVFIAHGNHGVWYDPNDRTNESCSMGPGWIEIPNHAGYDYFQRQLARMGIVAVGVYSNHSNCRNWTIDTILRRAEVVIGSISLP
jgi:hypothetical protein